MVQSVAPTVIGDEAKGNQDEMKGGDQNGTMVSEMSFTVYYVLYHHRYIVIMFTVITVHCSELTVSSKDIADPQMETKMELNHIIDFNVFQHIESEDQCDGKHPGTCKGLDRMIAALDYHQFTIVHELNEKYGDDPKELFIAFCDELYPRTAMLEDYIHFVEHHADPSSIEYIKGRLHFKCESATKCGATTRHYRDRRNDVNNGIEFVWCIDRIDSIHFMVHHLTELGLRVSADTLQNAVSSDDERG